MNESLQRICYDSDPACRVHHTVGRAEEYSLMSQFHYDSSLIILLFLRGHGDIRVEGRHYGFAEGDMILLSPSELHNCTMAKDETFERISLHISERILEGFGESGSGLFRAFYGRPHGVGNLLRADRVKAAGADIVMKQILARASGNGSADPILLRCKAIELLALINETIDSSAPNDESPHIENALILDILQYLNTHYCEEVSLSDVADRFFHSKYHVCHLFREQVGITMHEYLILRRIHLVNDLIRRGDPVTDACFSAGFKNYSNFFRLYKKHTGMTPQEFKASLRA